MNKKLDLKLLEDTINDLKNNPNACTTYGGATAIDGSFTILESNPGEKLKEFMEYFYENNLFNQNYIEDYNLIENKGDNDLSYEEVLTKLTYIFRGDRFCSGLIKSKVDDGTILRLIERLYNLNK